VENDNKTTKQPTSETGKTNDKISFSKRRFFIPLLLIGFLFLIYSIYQDVQKKTIEQFNSEKLILAKAASQGIINHIDHLQEDITFFSKFPNIVEFNDQGMELMVNYFNRNSKNIEAITRVDSKGIILNTYPVNKVAIRQNISYQKHVQQIIESHKPVISDVFFAVQGYPAIAIHVPIFKGNDFKGSLAILLAIDKIGKQYFEQINKEGSSNTYLLSENNTILFSPLEEHIGELIFDSSQNESSILQLIEKIKNADNGSINCIIDKLEKSDSGEKHIVFSRIKIGNTHWTILISTSPKEIYKTIVAFRNKLIIIFLIVFGVILLYFYFFTQVRNVLKEEKKRKKAENALRESEEKFRVLYDNSPDMHVSFSSADASIILCNNKLLEKSGYSIKEIIGSSIFKFYHEDCMVEAKKTFQEFISKGEIHGRELILKLKDGSRMDISLSVASIKDDKGKILYSISTLRDITERKKTEKQIKISAENWKSTFNAMSDSVSIIDNNGHLINHNSSTLEMFNISDKEIKSKRCWEMVHNLSQPIENCPIVRMKKSKKPESMVFQDGERWLEVSVDPIFDSEGNINGAVHVVSDITKRKQIVEDLRKSKEFANRLIDSSNDCIKVLDLKGNLLSMSSGGQKLLEISDITPYLNKSWIDFWKGKDNTAAKAAISKANKGKTGKLSGFCETEKGTPKWWEIIVTPIKDENDHIENLLAISRDITERRDAEETLNKSKEIAERYLNIAAEIIISLDSEGNITMLNDSGHELLGYKAGALIGKNWFNTCLPKNIQQDVRSFFNSLMTGDAENIVNYENPVINKNEDERTIFWHNEILKDDKGNIVGTLSSGEDITDRKKAKDELHKKLNELKIFNDVTVGRELKMIELKEEINAMLEQSGKKPKYKIPG